ncbi:MAG: ABC transporter ATP-binding protein [Thermoleophilia bacterium]|nr:ABC transporter ATP-binding protein [Thermoleophilia bacterium]
MKLNSKNPKPYRGEDRLRKVRWVLGLLRPYRKRIVVMLFAVVAASATSLAPPYLAGRAIDSGILTGDERTLTLIVIAFVILTAAYAATSYLQTYLVGWIGVRVLQDLREEVFKHIQKMSIGFFTRNRPGALISRMTNDIEALNQLISDGIVTLFSSILTLFGVVVILLLLDWHLALITFCVLPLLLLTSLVFRRYSAGAFKETRERISAITSHLQETLSGVRVVRSFGQEDRHINRMTELNILNRQANMKTVYLNATYFPATELMTAIGTGVILLYGGYQVVYGNIQVGVIISFIGYLQLFFDPIQQLAQLYATYQQGMAALDKIFGLLDTDVEIVDAPDAVDPGHIEGALSFNGVSFSYATEAERMGSADQSVRWAVKDIDLDIPAGETVALVGSTGAGKSTMAKLVTRFYDPQRGAILIDGEPLPHYRQRPLRRQMGIVPQEGFLFSGTIAENISFGRPDAMIDEIAAAADAVGASGFIERLPEGLETQVGERGVQLSSGQRQLVAFARIILTAPRILILDEATSSVDTQTERTIEVAMDRLLAGRTAIVIAHRLSTIRRADRIVVLDHGEIVETGSHIELISADGYYEKLYNAWTN